MTWNYRVVRLDYEDDSEYGIYEVYYDDDGKPISRTENPVGCVGVDMQELYDSFQYMSIAFSKPTLTEKDFIGEI
jgi:hypothetical protein